MKQTIVVENVDLELLDRQRDQLMLRVWDDPTDSDLWGLVNLLDAIVDKYLPREVA